MRAPAVDGGGHGGFHGRRFLAQAEGRSQQHRRTQNGAVGIGDAAARDVRRRAVDRLVEPSGSLAQRGRWQHPERSGQHRSLIGQDVAKHVLGDRDVEITRSADQMHGGGIHQHVLEVHVRELVAHRALGHLAPQARSLQHVGFVDRSEPAAPGTRKARRHSHHPFYLSHRIAAQIAGGLGRASLGAKINARRSVRARKSDRHPRALRS